MAKRKTNKKENKENKEEPVKQEDCGFCNEKMTLVELVTNCPLDEAWVIYNLARKGLMAQFEQELQDWGVREIEPTITNEEFYRMMKGDL